VESNIRTKYGGLLYFMAKRKVKVDPNEPLEIPMENLDLFVVRVLEALEESKDPYAIASVKNIKITPASNELFLFVGVTAKQTKTEALFAWTSAVNSSKVSWPDETEAD